MLTKGGKHAASNTNHVLHLGTNQAQNGHICKNTDLTALSELLCGAGKSLNLMTTSVDGHTDVHLTGGDEIHRDGVLVEDGKHTSKEAVGDGALVGMDVDDADVILDSDGSRSLGFPVVTLKLGRASCELVTSRQDRVGDNNGAVTARVLDVLNTDGDRGLGTDDLVHSKMMNDLGAVKGQLRRLGGRDGRQEPSGGNLGGVGREDAVDLLPDLQLLGLDAHGAEGGAQVRVAAADVAVDQAAGHVAEESRNHGDPALARHNLADKRLRGDSVEVVVEPFCSIIVE